MRAKYSLRFALSLISVLAIWFGWVSNVASHRRAARDALKQMGCYTPDPEVPAFALKLFGPEYFRHLDTIAGLYDRTSDDDLAALARVPEFTSIYTNRAWGGSLIAAIAIASGMRPENDEAAIITDRGMESLAEAKSLSGVVLWNTAVTG